VLAAMKKNGALLLRIGWEKEAKEEERMVARNRPVRPYASGEGKGGLVVNKRDSPALFRGDKESVEPHSRRKGSSRGGKRHYF